MPIIEVRHVSKEFQSSRTWRLGGSRATRAVNDVSLSVEPGLVYGLVGESGSGKTTLGRLMLGLVAPTAGQILFEGRDISKFSRVESLEFRRRAQLIMQNPYSALNPRRTIEDSLKVGIEVHRLASGRAKRERLVAILEQVGMGPEALSRYPHEFSGGQRQRLVIARALAVEPSLIIADEAVSALDVSIQAQVLNVLRGLQRQLGFTLLLISHDLRVIYHMSDQIGVMYLGKLVEQAPKRELYERPLHPYTKELITAAPRLEPGSAPQRLIRGELMDVPPPPDGCVFTPRCSMALPECAGIIPDLEEKAPAHTVACWRVPVAALDSPPPPAVASGPFS